MLMVWIAAGCTSTGTLVKVDSRQGIQQGFIHLMPETPPVASVILFAGGDGNLRLTSGATMAWGASNFLVRSRYKFLNQGFQVAVIDSPEGGSGHLTLERQSPEHLQDIKAVAAFLKSRANVPVWLVGTSRGTDSVASLAIHGKDIFSGAVFTSTVENALYQDIPKITMPSLVLHNTNDGCIASFPHVARALFDRLENAPRKNLVWLTSSARTSPECHASSPHGYLGIESEAVGVIADFIKGY